MVFSADDTCDVGMEAVVVSDDYGLHDNAFTGAVNWVQIDIDDAAADDDHRIERSERMRVVPARQ